MSLRRFRLVHLFFAACLIAGGISVVHSQGTRTLVNVQRRIDTMNRQAKDFERENMGRDGNTKVDAEAAKRTRQVRVELEEDLKALQTIYNNTVIALQSTKGFPAGFSTEAGRAVRKHAARLQANLNLPDLDQKEARTGPPTLPDTDRKTLTALCKVIYSFITNPMFDGTGALNAESGAKARMELEAMIRLADHLSVVPETDPV